MTLLPLSVPSRLPVAPDTSAAQHVTRNKAREETTLTSIEICFAWAYKQIAVGFVLETSLRNVDHQHRKNQFWKSSWLQQEIVSHIEAFKRPYKNHVRDVCSGKPLGFGQEQPKSLQSRWQFQMSHIEVCPSSGFCSFIGTHTLSLALDWLVGTAAPHRKWRLHSFPSACRWSLILGQPSGTSTKRWNPVELCKILYL